MSSQSRSIACLLLVCVTGCSGDSDHPADDPLQQRITDAVARIQADTCFAQADTSACAWGDFSIRPEDFAMTRSTGEAILVVDTFDPGFYPELLRYRNRLRGVYQIDGDQIAPRVPSTHLPEVLGEVLVSFADPDGIPARALTELSAAVDAQYGKIPLLFPGHGGVVFGHLIELVPEQPLVLLDLNHLLDIPAVVCQGIDESSLAAATAHFSAVAASIRQVMTDHQVHFLNASFGSTAPVLAEEWPRSCPGVAVPDSDQLRQVLHIYDPFYELLFHTGGVIAAHAAANLGSAADFPFDQVNAQFPNQVRVGFISSLSSGLDEQGRGAVHKDEQFPDDGSADVYLNWGCKTLGPCSDPHYEMSAAFGLAMGELPITSSSYISPLAVARLINLRYANHASEPMTDELVSVLRTELTPALCGSDGTQPCVYQDPILHHQLESDRLDN